MRNSLLKISGIFGISGDVEIHFPKRGLVAIQGENGAGKSSILDSLSVALFGEPTPARAVKNADILSRSRERGHVSLEFEWPGGGAEVERVRYRVDREFRRTKRGAVNHKAFLYEVPEDGEPVGIATGPDAVAERIASVISGGQIAKEGSELIKIVRSAWLSSIFLPQGEVTRLLRMRPAERREIISALFGLEEGDVLKDRSKALLQVAEEEVKEQVAGEKLLKETLESHPVKTVGEGERAVKVASDRLLLLGKKRMEAESRKAMLESFAELLTDEATLKSSLTEQQSRLKRMEQEYELSCAYEAYLKVKTGAQKLTGAIGMGRDCKQRAGRAREESASLEKEVALLKSKREETEKALKAARPLALLAGDVKTIRELRDSLRKTYADIKSRKAQLEKTQAIRAGVLSALATKIVDEAGTELEKAKRALDKAVAQVSSSGESLRDRLVDWLALLSGGDDIVRVADVREMSGEKFARSLEDARFSEFLKRVGDARGAEEKARAEVAKGNAKLKEAEQEALDIMNFLPEGDEVCTPPSEFARLDASGLRKQAALLEKEESSIRGILSGVAETAEDMKARGMELSKRLGGEDEDKCLQMEQVAGELGVRLEAENRELEKLLGHVGDKKASIAALLGEIETAKQSEDLFRERYLALTADWRDKVKGWGKKNFEDMRSFAILRSGPMVTEDALRLCRERYTALVGERAGLIARRERIEQDNKGLPQSREACVSALEEARAASKNAEEEYSVALSAHARAERDLETYRELSGKLRKTRTEMKSILPAYEKARSVAKLLEGNSFGNFLQDKALSTLLGYVNAGLQRSARWNKYAFHSEGGAIMVRDEDGTRDAASLSGGEATMAALLLLRGMQAVSGIGGMMAIDEGFAQLDTKNLEDVVETLSALSADSLIIAITHDPDFAREFDVLWKVEQGGRIILPDEGSGGKNMELEKE